MCFEEDIGARLMGETPSKILKPDAEPEIFVHRRPKVDTARSDRVLRRSLKKACLSVLSRQMIPVSKPRLMFPGREGIDEGRREGWGEDEGRDMDVPSLLEPPKEWLDKLTPSTSLMPPPSKRKSTEQSVLSQRMMPMNCEHEVGYTDDDVKDPTYEPDYDDDDDEESDEMTQEFPEESPFPKRVVDDDKFIVFGSCLDKLFYKIKCEECYCNVETIKKGVVGTGLFVTMACTSGHEEWSSRPLEGRMLVGNLLTAASILYSGLTYQRVSSFASLLNLKLFSPFFFLNSEAIPCSRSEFSLGQRPNVC
ncbi:hypothetical protein HOLleu_02897 [Holothuria leucospilota]|uniref:Uncharacterized protein n=1 Tax=Holothuria leucospilota TaxID=206669 RepID=A0A9Q1CS81_HOLLE|nr:hypothetical protein HOLleu_02897 [Holothuria leucospilota]